MAELSLLPNAGRHELKQAFLELRAKGYSLERCSKLLQVAKSTLCNWSHELEAEIARFRAVRLEALQEQYFMVKEGRIRFLAHQLEEIQKELRDRSLEDVPTAKLLEAQLSYYKELQAEYVEPQYLSDEEVAELDGRTKSSPKMNAEQIAGEMEKVHLRQKAGLITSSQAKEELATLNAMLKAYELAVLEKKYDRLESVLEDRNVHQE